MTARNDITGDALTSKVLVKESKKKFDIGFEVLSGVKNDDGSITTESGTYKFVNGEWIEHKLVSSGSEGSSTEDTNEPEAVHI